MTTPYEAARLNLQLFELRRDPVLREARHWFMHEFNPETFEDLVAVIRGERNASFRMVTGYWDMAASLVTSGAIDSDSFLAAHGEIYITFSKIQLLLDELRRVTGETLFCRHIEDVVLAVPDVNAMLERRRNWARATAKARAEAAALQ